MNDIEKAKQLFFDGIGCLEREEYPAAEQAFREALLLTPGRASVITNLAGVLIRQKKHEEAMEYALQSTKLDPGNAQGYLNVGLCLAEGRNFLEAIAKYDNALEINPAYAEAWLNRGVALSELERLEEALVCQDKALFIDRDNAKAWFNRGNFLKNLGRNDEALVSYASALSLNPEIEYCYGSWLFTKMSLCDWDEIEHAADELNRMVVMRKKVVTPFEFLAMPGSSEAQKICAEIYSADFVSQRSNFSYYEVKGDLENNKRLKIGYFSADFHAHATAQLMAEFFERHDRSRFELFAFSFGPDTGDEMQQRVRAAFDHFIDVSDIADAEVVSMVRSIGIHIAIDLKGYTQASRPNIFSQRVAPIQINYLGYPGTMGMQCMDYVVADRTLITPDEVEHYTEKVVFMPHSYQVNDGTKKISDLVQTRKEHGLPESGFVFACFNNTYKISPDVFDIWMRLLKQVPGSVLWLFQSNKTVSANLRKAAETSGVAPNRLVFAEWMDLAGHLARHRAADLFLDTFYYNAHTTASDALWAGLPVVTCKGRTFAARVVASLLNAIGLPELITDTPERYEELAYDLATNQNKFASVKNRLAHNRLTHPLYDAGLFAKHMGVAYEVMWDRCKQGLEPDHIYVQE